VDGYNGATGNIQLEVATAMAVRLTSVVFQLDGSAQVVGQGAPDITYVIEASNDLVTWTEFGTVLSDGAGVFSFTDYDAPSSGVRFYRAHN